MRRYSINWPFKCKSLCWWWCMIQDFPLCVDGNMILSLSLCLSVFRCTSFPLAPSYLCHRVTNMMHKKPLTIEMVLTQNHLILRFYSHASGCINWGVGGSEGGWGGTTDFNLFFSCGFLSFLEAIRLRLVVVWLLFSSVGSFVHQEEAFNT